MSIKKNEELERARDKEVIGLYNLGELGSIILPREECKSLVWI